MCSPVVGRLNSDAYQTETTDEVGDTDLLNACDKATGFIIGLNASESSVCSPGVGRHFLDADLAGITDEAFGPDLFSALAEALGFSEGLNSSTGEPLPETDLAVHTQLTSVSHAEGSSRPHLHRNPS